LYDLIEKSFFTVEVISLVKVKHSENKKKKVVVVRQEKRMLNCMNYWLSETLVAGVGE